MQTRSAGNKKQHDPSCVVHWLERSELLYKISHDEADFLVSEKYVLERPRALYATAKIGRQGREKQFEGAHASKLDLPPP